ncbi:hypothetical protein JW777_08875, partial [bacterium]|nr:hypothetical protein [bacterium]
LKAGILEAADIFVINKADRDGAERLKADIESMVSMREPGTNDRRAPIILTVAVNGRGIDEVAAETERHLDYLEQTGRREERRQQRIRLELVEALEAAWQKALGDSAVTSLLEKTTRQITAGEISLSLGSIRILRQLSGCLRNDNDQHSPPE